MMAVLGDTRGVDHTGGPSFDRRMRRSRVNNGTPWARLVAAIGLSAGLASKSRRRSVRGPRPRRPATLT